MVLRYYFLEFYLTGLYVSAEMTEDGGDSEVAGGGNVGDGHAVAIELVARNVCLFLLFLRFLLFLLLVAYALALADGGVQGNHERVLLLVEIGGGGESLLGYGLEQKEILQP